MNPYIRTMLCILIALSSVAGIGVGTASASQNSQTQKFAMEYSGAEIMILNLDEVSFQPNSYRNSASTESGEYQEYVQFTVGTSVVAVYILNQGDVEMWHANSVRNIASNFWRGGEIILEGLTDSHSSLFIRGNHTLQYEHYFYGEFNLDADGELDIAATIYGSPETILEDIEIARNNISVNHASIFPDVDLAKVDSAVSGTLDATSQTLIPEGSPLGDLERYGFVSETKWDTRPVGTSITWDGDEWAFPFESSAGIYFSEPKNGYVFMLYQSNHLAQANFLLDEYQPLLDEEMAYDRLGSSGYLGSNASDGRHLTLIDWFYDGSAGIAVYDGTLKCGEPFIQISVVQRVALPDGSGIRIQLAFVATEEHIGEMWDSYVDNVQIEGFSLDGLWNDADVEAILSGSQTWNGDYIPADDSEAGTTATSSTDDTTAVTRTSRTSTTAQTQPSGDFVVAEVTGITINLGPSGDVVFDHDQHVVAEHPTYVRETFFLVYDTTLIIIDVMEGDVDPEDYWQRSEAAIAETFDYMEWIGGFLDSDGFGDVYSGAYKLDYREHIYLEFFHDSNTGISYGVGVYGAGENLPVDIAWLHDNVTIDGSEMLPLVDASHIESIIAGESGLAPEVVEKPSISAELWESVGLASDTEWNNPYFDISFNWVGVTWVFPFQAEDAIIGDEVYTRLELRTSDRRGEVKLTTVETDYTPAELVESFTSEEQLATQSAAGIEMIVLDTWIGDETSSAIVMHSTELGHPVVMIFDVYVNQEGITVITELSAAPGDIATVYASFWDSVQSNGEFYPLTWTIEDIEAIEFD